MRGQSSKRPDPAIVLGAVRAQRQRVAAQRARRRLSLLATVALVSLGVLAFAFVVVTVTPIAAAAAAYQLYGKDVEARLAQLENLDQRQTFASNRIYDRNGTLLLEFWGEGRRIPVTLGRIAPDLRNATIATEDKTFWDNPGVDPQAIARAIVQNNDGEIRSGASTITQQLVRNLVFSYDERISPSYDRKIKEVVLAYMLARMRSKTEIFNLYLNEVYYGHLAYGIEAASETYFGKHASELTLAEAALLAGLPQSPADLDPLDPSKVEYVKARQRTVLDLMVEQNYITQAQADAAYRQELHFREQTTSLRAPHFVNYVREQLVNMLGADRVAQGGLTITTTLDLRLQDQVQAITLQHVAEVSRTNHLTNASVVLTRPDTGEIMAMVGSVNYYDKSIDGQVNVATAERQPGSSIKPLVYAMAFQKGGLTPGYYIYDQALTVRIPGQPAYKPINYDHKFHGQITLRMALGNSFNIPAVKLVRFDTVPGFIDFAHKMGITTFNRDLSWYGLSIGLGGAEVKLVDMATAYGVFANSGQMVRATPFLKVVDVKGNVLYDLKPAPQPVLDPRVTFMLQDLMSDNQARVLEFGLNTPLKVSRQAGVKTGTTNDFKDNWTIGYTRYMVAGVWAGNSDGSPMVNSTGVTGAAPIWHDVMEYVFAHPEIMKDFVPSGEVPDGFVPPPGVVKTAACVPVGPGACKKSTDWFYADAIPGKGKNTGWGAGGMGVPQYDTYRVLRLGKDQADYCLPTPAQKVPDKLLSDLKVPRADSASAQDLKLLVEALGNYPTLNYVSPAAEQNTPPAGVQPPPCTDQQVAAAVTGTQAANTPNNQVAGLSYYISSPAPGGPVHGLVPIMGSAVFGSDFQYYKVEIAGKDGQWLTINSGHSNNVSNGQLEVLNADALKPGDYLLRLVVVGKDGNFPTPYVVPIVIGPAGP